MLVLAIDTALGAVSACAFDAERDEILSVERIALERGHAEAAIPLIDRVMARVPGGFDAIDRVAACVGPGSFTGIRVGVAAARAIGLACDAPVVGVTALAAFAAPLLDGSSDVVSAIDARHGCVFYQCFGPDGESLTSPMFAPIPEVARSLRQRPLKVTGTGAKLLAIEAWSIGLKAEAAGEMVSPDVGYVARLASIADPAEAAAKPFYLKAPDVALPAASNLAASA